MAEPQQAGLQLDLNGSHKVWLGPKDEFGYVWAWQNGIIFAWSESNIRYESAWWLNSDGSPAIGKTQGQQQIIDKLNKERPFDPDWLKETARE
jgi:hypothetical protein